MTSPSVRLATVLLGEPLEGWVAQRRDNGASWATVAADLAQATDGQVALSGEYLRQLYGASVEREDGAA